MSNRWQASATYTLGGLWDALGRPLQGAGNHAGLVDFELAPDLDGEDMRLSSTDLRHRASWSGIWEVGRGLSR